ncbi:hypothetical protein D3C72_1508650 [compost metagenome]
MAQPGFVEGVQRLAQFAQHMAYAVRFMYHAAEVGQAAAGQFLDHFESAAIPAAGGHDLGYVLAGQTTDHIVHGRVGFRAWAVKGEYSLACGFLVHSKVTLAHAVGVADLTDQRPAFDQGFAERWRIGARCIWHVCRYHLGGWGVALQAHQVAWVHGMAVFADDAMRRGRVPLRQVFLGMDDLRPPAVGMDRLAGEVPVARGLVDSAFAEHFLDRACGVAVWAESNHEATSIQWRCALVRTLWPCALSRSCRRSRSSRWGIPAIHTLPFSSNIRSRALSAGCKGRS